MPTEPVALIISLFELSLLLVGGFLLFRLGAQEDRRTWWFGANRMPPWPVTLPEFGIFVFLIFGCGVFCQVLLNYLTKGLTAGAADWLALQLSVNGLGLDGGGLLGWLLFRSMQKTWHADAGAPGEPPVLPPPAPLPWARVGRYAIATLLVALPVIVIFNLGWMQVLKLLGLPDEPQDLIAIFANAKSPLAVAALLAVACGLAPVYEEVLFRAGLYRFCRQKLGRPWALLLSGCLFGAMHQNLASFVPLSLFGMVLALAYEATGSLRVAIIAHGLFNLNTVLIVLAGLS